MSACVNRLVAIAETEEWNTRASENNKYAKRARVEQEHRERERGRKQESAKHLWLTVSWCLITSQDVPALFEGDSQGSLTASSADLKSTSSLLSLLHQASY